MATAADFIKENFPDWETYCTIEGSELTADDFLTQAINRAVEELSDYVTIADNTLSTSQKRHFLNIVRRNCFLYKHAATDFERKPQIIRDYEDTIEKLKLTGQSGDITMEAKTKRFDVWFTDPYDDLTSTEE